LSQKHALLVLLILLVLPSVNAVSLNPISLDVGYIELVKYQHMDSGFEGIQTGNVKIGVYKPRSSHRKYIKRGFWRFDLTGITDVVHNAKLLFSPSIVTTNNYYSTKTELYWVEDYYSFTSGKGKELYEKALFTYYAFNKEKITDQLETQKEQDITKQLNQAITEGKNYFALKAKLVDELQPLSYSSSQTFYSTIKGMKLIYEINNKPELEIFRSEDSNNLLSLEWKSSDKDGDELLFDVYYSEISGAKETLLQENLIEEKFDINSSIIKLENYYVDIVAKDGFEETVKSTKLIDTVTPECYKPTIHSETYLKKGARVKIKILCGEPGLLIKPNLNYKNLNLKFNEDSSYSLEFDLIEQQDGNQSFELSVKDDYGNEQILKSMLFIDNIPPETPKIKKELLTNDYLDLWFQSDDNLSGLQELSYNFNGKWVSRSFLRIDEPGKHSVKVRATDKAGNSSSKTFEFELKEKETKKDKRPKTLRRPKRTFTTKPLVVNTDEIILLVEQKEKEIERSLDTLSEKFVFLGLEKRKQFNEIKSKIRLIRKEINSYAANSLNRDLKLVKIPKIKIKASNVRNLTRSKRSYEVIEIQTEDQNRIQTNVTLHIVNDTNKVQSNVSIIETIPKEVAESATQLQFYPMVARIIEDDPVVEWIIPELKPGEEIKLNYVVQGDKGKDAEYDLEPVLSFEPKPEVVYDAIVKVSPSITPKKAAVTSLVTLAEAPFALILLLIFPGLFLLVRKVKEDEYVVVIKSVLKQPFQQKTNQKKSRLPKRQQQPHPTQLPHKTEPCQCQTNKPPTHQNKRQNLAKE